MIAILTADEVTLVADKYIRIQERLIDFGTPYVIRSMMVPTFY